MRFQESELKNPTSEWIQIFQKIIRLKSQKLQLMKSQKNSTDNDSVMLSFKFPFNAGIMSKKNSEIESNVEILQNQKSQYQENRLPNCKSS